MRRTFTDLGAIIQDVASRKARAARARFVPATFGSEVPRDVYLNACAHLAASFAAQGFRYAASKQHFSTIVPPFTYWVGFQSSHNNVAGEYIALWIHAGVRSAHLKRWRAQQPHPLTEGDVVVGGQLGNLREPKAWLEWNLADRAVRPAMLDDAGQAIQGIAIPYFSRFRDPLSLIDALTVSDVPELSIVRAVELSLCLGTRQQTVAIVSRFLRERPELRDTFQEAVTQLQSQGFSGRPPSSYAQQLAWVSRAYDLDFGSPGA